MTDQQQKAIEYFNALNKRKVEFNPPIKIKDTPHSYPLWIDDMTKIRDNHFMLTISNQDNEDRKKNLLSLEPNELNSLVIRLFSMQPKP